MKIYYYFLVINFVFQSIVLFPFDKLFAQTNWERPRSYIKQGYHSKLILWDYGGMGAQSISEIDPNAIGLEYPVGSLFEHLSGSNIWVGALIDTGSIGNPKWIKAVSVWDWASIDTIHPWYHTSILNTGEPNKRLIDDDNDGKIDEDELDGIDNDGDDKIDEDYWAVSESDYYCGYTDTFKLPAHIPLGIKVWQRSYAWATLLTAPILPFECYLINLGKRKLKDVYIGINFLAWVGSYLSRAADINNCAGYWPELRTGYVYAPNDHEATPVGFTILETPYSLSDLEYYSYRWFVPYRVGGTDTLFYNFLSGLGFPNQPRIMPNQSPSSQHFLNDILFSFGPFNDWNSGDTLKLSFAIINGLRLEFSPYNLREVAMQALTLYARNFFPPVIVPSPKLRIESGFQSVKINWGYTGSAISPEETWDDASQAVQLYPSDHWRRRNPPEGHTKGGRIFEGYRLYRSEDPAGTAKSFVMLGQWDMIDGGGPRFEYDTGIETTFIDENLKTGKTYWYSVTSFGIPDVHVMDYVDWDGSIKVETLATKSMESSVLASRKRIKMPFSVSNELNKVLVVPNPYRVDEEYTFEMGGYEGLAKVWNENKRLLKFIHLPPKCTIRIFTLSGDIITTLYHEDAVRGELDWNLLSESNRTIASGVYVFTVESEYGTQMGKFVVIR